MMFMTIARVKDIIREEAEILTGGLLPFFPDGTEEDDDPQFVAMKRWEYEVFYE